MMRGAKVDDLDRAAVVDINQNIFWFQITMSYVIIVTIKNGL